MIVVRTIEEPHAANNALLCHVGLGVAYQVTQLESSKFKLKSAKLTITTLLRKVT